MNKFIKISLMVAAIFGVLGIAGIVTGKLMGGSLLDYNQIGIFNDGGEMELYPDYENIGEQFEDKLDDWEDTIDRIFDYDEGFDHMDEMIDF